MISERYPQVELRFFRKESVSGMLPEMMADMEKNDAVVGLRLRLLHVVECP